MEKEILLRNINKIHTTIMGTNRIKRNLSLSQNEVVEYCKKIIQNKNTHVYRQGKNWYCMLNDIILTINVSSYTIITAKKK